MDENSPEPARGDVWFVYDGDCPICNLAARALRIKKTVGNLHLVNAREEKHHRLIGEINDRQLDLDEGMVLVFGGRFYHGEDALHMMALLGSGRGWFNRLNAVLFRSEPIARFCYPAMRAARNGLLRLGGRQKIRNLSLDPEEPIFKAVLAEQWNDLPPVMQKHYAVRPYSEDVVKIKGHLDIDVSLLVGLMARLTGALPAHSGRQVPVTVVFRSGKDSAAFHFERVFHYPVRGEVAFHSKMEVVGGNELVEFMRFGVGWKLACEWDGSKIILRHKGYVWRVFGVMIPIPFALIMGKGHAEEVPISDDGFAMWTHTLHPLFGKTFGYAGEFKVTEVVCDRS